MILQILKNKVEKVKKNYAYTFTLLFVKFIISIFKFHNDYISQFRIIAIVSASDIYNGFICGINLTSHSLENVHYASLFRL